MAATLICPWTLGYLGLLFTSEKQQQYLETLRGCPDHMKVLLVLVRFLVLGKGEQHHVSKAGGAPAWRVPMLVLILARVITSLCFSFLFSKMGGLSSLRLKVVVLIVLGIKHKESSKKFF